MNRRRTSKNDHSRGASSGEDEADMDLHIDEREVLKTLIGSMPDHIYAKDLNHRFVLCNDAVVKNMGMTSQSEVIGKADTDFLPPQHVRQYLSDEKRVLGTGEPLLNREEQVLTPGGGVRWALTSKVPVRDRGGKVIGLVGINRDITELKRLRDKEHAFVEAVKRELALAERMQKCIIPEDLPRPDGWDLAADFMPAFEVGGDFYDVFALDRDTVAFFIGDVSGKSISAAILMSHTTTLLRAFTQQLHTEAHSPLEVVDVLNRHICSYQLRKEAEVRFVSLFFGVLNTRSGVLEYVNAGHVPPYVASADGRLRGIAPTGMALGLKSDAAYRSDAHELHPGDLLFAYTDGITEAMNEEGTLFSKDRLKPILSGNRMRAGTYVEAVAAAVRKHAGGREHLDDIAMLALKRKAAGGPHTGSE